MCCTSRWKWSRVAQPTVSWGSKFHRPMEYGKKDRWKWGFLQKEWHTFWCVLFILQMVQLGSMLEVYLPDCWHTCTPSPPCTGHVFLGEMATADGWAWLKHYWCVGSCWIWTVHIFALNHLQPIVMFFGVWGSPDCAGIFHHRTNKGLVAEQFSLSRQSRKFRCRKALVELAFFAM